MSKSSTPETDDHPYVAAYKIIYNDDSDDDDVSNEADNEPKFRVFITTKRLLKIAANSKTIHADATYKLVWEGMPVIIVGSFSSFWNFSLYK